MGKTSRSDIKSSRQKDGVVIKWVGKTKGGPCNMWVRTERRDGKFIRSWTREKP